MSYILRGFGVFAGLVVGSIWWTSRTFPKRLRRASRMTRADLYWACGYDNLVLTDKESNEQLPDEIKTKWLYYASCNECMAYLQLLDNE